MTTADAGGFSHRGARQHNEDALLLCDDLGLYAVADGVGGAQGGEVASRIVCATLETSTRAGQSLVTAMDQAHADILSAAASGEGVPGSASTAVAVKLTGAQLELAWVGDSRAYLWDGELQLLSKDHSLVQSLVDTAQLDFADIEQHPQKNIINQALGSRNGAPVAACKQGVLRTPCVLMLCSDGVSGELSEQMLIATLTNANSSATDCARTLVEAAVNGGGQDNASCIVIRLPRLAAAVDDAATLAFMRFGQDQRWHLADVPEAENTRINPSVQNSDDNARAATGNSDFVPAYSPGSGPGKLLRAAVFLISLVAIVYAVEQTVTWASLLQLLRDQT